MRSVVVRVLNDLPGARFTAISRPCQDLSLTRVPGDQEEQEEGGEQEAEQRQPAQHARPSAFVRKKGLHNIFAQHRLMLILHVQPLRALNSSQLNRTYNAAPATTTGAIRKNSTSLASGPPWNGTKDLPRHHDDPVKAILALNKIVGIASN